MERVKRSSRVVVLGLLLAPLGSVASVAVFSSNAFSACLCGTEQISCWEMRLGRTGRLPALALDPLGEPHLAVLRGHFSRRLQHYSRSSGEWQVETIHDQADIRSRADLAFDVDGRLQIVFAWGEDTGKKFIAWGWRGTPSWMVTQVDSVGSLASFKSPRIALPPGSRDPHIVFIKSVDVRKTLMYASRSFFGAQNDGWKIEPVDPTRQPSSSALAFDANADPHVVYLTPDGSAFHATRPVGSADWVIEAIGETPSGGYGIDLTIDGAGALHVCWGGDANGLVYATKTGGAWVLTTVDAARVVRNHTAIGVLSTGAVRIAYSDYTNFAQGGDVKPRMAFYDGVEWLTERMPPVGSVSPQGMHIDLAVSSDDSLKVVYEFDGSTFDDIRYWEECNVGAGPSPAAAFAPGSSGLMDRRGSFELGEAARVTIRLYDVAGRLVRADDRGHWVAGRYDVSWASDDLGMRNLPGSVYFGEVLADGMRVAVGKVIHLR